MADFVVTSTADSGSGSLREGLAQIRNGETITFDDSLEDKYGVITIELAADSAALSLPDYKFTIEGGSHTGSGETLKTRVVIDAAASADDLRRVATCANSSKPTINNVTFKNGYLSTSNYGGGLFVTYSGDVVLNYCVFDTCHATDAGAIVFLNTAKGTINNCYFYNCNATIGGVSEIRSTSDVVFNNCVFDRCFASSNGNVIYTTGTPIATINNCVFISVANNSKSTIYNIGTNTDGSLIINGSTTCDRVQFADNSTTGINGKLTADVITINNGASVTFSGVDSILAATTTATIGSATFTAAENSMGYAAFPSGTDTSAATFTGVKTAIYGAGASDFHAQVTSLTTASLSWSQTDSDVPVLLEAQESESDTWTTLSASATSPYTVTDDDIDDLTFRIFDGESFYTAAGSYTFAKFYQVVAGYVPRNNDTTPHSWQTVIKLLTVNEMNENLKPGQDCAILARVYDAFDNDSPLLNLGSNISSVYYTCEKKTKGLYTTEWSPVNGHNNVSAGADCVLSSLQTDDAWDIDNVGYNFLLSPEISTHQLFDSAGLYRIKATINPVDGDPITFYKEINVVE